MDDASNILRDIERKVSVGDNQKSFNLLYSSVDKVNVDDFHVQCDGKGPTLTVLYGKYNTIFGGYTSQEWCSDKQRTKRDENAFLFYKNDHAEATCTFLPIKEKFVDRAITCDANFGPTFGGGAFFWEAYDLQTFKKDNKKSESEREAGSYMKLNGAVNFGCAYGLEDNQMPRRGASATRREARFEDSFRENCTIGTPRQKDINAGALVVKRIEVYQVVDDQLQEPWRTKPSDTEMEEIRKKLEKMEPLPGLGIKTYNILLVGVIGSGKSSFYNTLATVFMGAVKSHAPARDAPTSVTNEIHAYELKSKSGKPLNLRIFDIRGFEAERGYEHEFDLLLNGRLPVGFSFPDQPGPIQQGELVNASLKDEIHLVCFVTGTSNLDTITDDLHKHITSIQKSINRKGLPMVVVATKFDDLCQKISEDANRVYRSPKARDATKTVSNFFGIQEKYIFPIVNYVNDENIKDGKERLALQALNTMIELTRDYLENHKEMASKLDRWSERASKLHIPRHSNEKEIELMKIGAEFEELGDNVLRVLCVGPVYSGKTSFIDSISSALRDEIYSKATGGYATGRKPKDGHLESSTERYKMYQMKYKHESEDIIDSNVFIGDIPGFQESDGIQLDDVKNVILGHVPIRYKIIQGMKRGSKKFKHRPLKKDKVHCVCFVFDVSTPADELSEKMQKTLKSLQAWLLDKDIPYIVILTKGDLLSDVVDECKLHVFENKILKENKDILIDMFKFKQSKMFPVINYIHEDTVVPESDALLLSAFKEILKLGKEYLEDMDEDGSEDSDDEENGTEA
ncbi:uncharacterized protein LOC132744342 isoform X2 [Ruditapes philippinarum]|uniref:uncharacterized protein LOC132744342 isoform X1 n=1 Tax=Ruditapes philippinarum TaxID=129788 RepID=UPI00295A669A|nr:uncharacterized protein LOC132744342 isoform X1 [Ruditapes philippinarum]XP_060589011.1 uncharacterized protein LOC132744342 isoform X2 [Ruditapes philippinarum]